MICNESPELSHPPLFLEEHSILDSMDLPILPSNLSASDRVRLIIETLQKSREPTTVSTPSKTRNNGNHSLFSAVPNDANAPDAPDAANAATAKPYIPKMNSVPLGFNLPEGYRVVQPLNRPNNRNNVMHDKTDQSSKPNKPHLEHPFKAENIDGKVTDMIQDVLTYQGNQMNLFTLEQKFNGL